MEIRYAVSVLMRDVLVLFQPTSKRILLIFVLAGVVLTSGCFRIFNMVNEGYAMKTVAQLLEEKYGEEFTVIDTWLKMGETYTAVCSPVAEPKIVFEATYRTGDESSLRHDEYVQGIVAFLLAKKLQPEVQKITEDAHLQVIVFWQETDFARREDVSIESYLQSIGSEGQHIMFEIYANIGNIKNIDYIEVYSVLESISNSIAPNSGSIRLIYMSTEDIEKCREYFLKQSDIYPEIGRIYKEYDSYGTGIDSGVIKESFDQFKSEMELIVNGNIEGNGSNAS